MTPFHGLVLLMTAVGALAAVKYYRADAEPAAAFSSVSDSDATAFHALAARPRNAVPHLWRSRAPYGTHRHPGVVPTPAHFGTLPSLSGAALSAASGSTAAGLPRSDYAQTRLEGASAHALGFTADERLARINETRNRRGARANTKQTTREHIRTSLEWLGGALDRGENRDWWGEDD